MGSISSRKQGASSYIYDANAGKDTWAYILDTGIRTTHVEFEGRASFGFNALENTEDIDRFGHGTHVAGIIGSKTYGVAKKTNLIAVKIYDMTTSASAVISGFQWAVKDIVSKNRTSSAVINMSIAGLGSDLFDAAVTEGWKQGVLSVGAAGNMNADAANYSPGRSTEVLTVGNVNASDWRAQGWDGSNYGPAVDIWAAGVNIPSTYYLSDTDTKNMTGTSMAAPAVAGLVSYLRSVEGKMSAEAVKARVLALATPGRVIDGKGAANLLAYNGNGR